MNSSPARRGAKRRGCGRVRGGQKTRLVRDRFISGRDGRMDLMGRSAGLVPMARGFGRAELTRGYRDGAQWQARRGAWAA